MILKTELSGFSNTKSLRNLRYQAASLGDLTHRVALELFRAIAFAVLRRISLTFREVIRAL